MWWKIAEGIKNDADFQKFRTQVLTAPVSVREKDGIAEITVSTPGGVLGVKTDVTNKKRLAYYNPVPLPVDYLFQVDGVEIGKPILKKYKLNTTK